jgi:hypothetical protein
MKRNLLKRSGSLALSLGHVSSESSQLCSNRYLAQKEEGSPQTQGSATGSLQKSTALKVEEAR